MYKVLVLVLVVLGCLFGCANIAMNSFNDNPEYEALESGIIETEEVAEEPSVFQHFMEEYTFMKFELDSIEYLVEIRVVTDSYAYFAFNGEEGKVDIGDSEEFDCGLMVEVLDTIVDDDYSDVVEFKVWHTSDEN